MEQLFPALFFCNNNEKSLKTQVVTGQELPKNQVAKSHVPNWVVKKEINKKFFAKADSLINKKLSCPRIKHTKLRNLNLDGSKTGILLSGFAQQIRQKNADVPDIYFTLLDAAGVSPTLFLNQNVTTKERDSWIPFKIWTSEVAKAVHARRCCLWVCAQLGKS